MSCRLLRSGGICCRGSNSCFGDRCTADVCPVDAIIQFFATHNTAAKFLNLRTMVSRRAAPFLFPLLHGRACDAQSLCQTLHAQSGSFRSPIQWVIHGLIQRSSLTGE